MAPTTTLTFKLPITQKQALHDAAIASNRHVSEVLRESIDAYLSQHSLTRSATQDRILSPHMARVDALELELTAIQAENNKIKRHLTEVTAFLSSLGYYPSTT